MPKLKPSSIKKQNDIIYTNIKSRCIYFGCQTDKDAGAKIGMSKDTFYCRRKNGQWKSDELTRAAEALKVSFAWLVTDHTKIEEINK